MKNKVYFLLIPLYVLMVVFILLINGVFTGEVTSISNLLINVGFLLLIGIMFAVSVITFRKLNRFTDALKYAGEEMRHLYQERGSNLWEDYQARENAFGHKMLDEAFEKYQKRMAGYQTRKGLKAVCDLGEYINEDLLDREASSHYNSAVSGTLTGLGILGTFLGLSMGLGSFDGNDIYTISDNVGPLLEGMKVAFHTSVYGIFFSLVFNFIYRIMMADAYEVLAEFHTIYRQCVAPSVATTDEHAAAMLVYQANMSNYMKQMTELLKGNAREQTQAVERIADQFVAQMGRSLGTEFDKLGRSLNFSGEVQKQCSRDYQSMERTAQELLAANQSMQQVLAAIAEHQNELAGRLDAQERRLSDTCDAINEELSSQLFTFNQMRDMYEK